MQIKQDIIYLESCALKSQRMLAKALCSVCEVINTVHKLPSDTEDNKYCYVWCSFYSRAGLLILSIVRMWQCMVTKIWEVASEYYIQLYLNRNLVNSFPVLNRITSISYLQNQGNHNIAAQHRDILLYKLFVPKVCGNFQDHAHKHKITTPTNHMLMMKTK